MHSLVRRLPFVLIGAGLGLIITTFLYPNMSFEASALVTFFVIVVVLVIGEIRRKLKGT